MSAESRKPLYWIASSLKDLKAIAVPVQKTFGTALRDVQYGETPDVARPLSGWRGIKTPRGDIELVRSRLKLARKHYEESKREEDHHG